MDNRLTKEQKLLLDIAKIQKEVDPTHHSVDSITDKGLFGGTNSSINLDKNGNVVLTRITANENQLGKNWKNIGYSELVETSLFHGGGGGLPTSGFNNWTDQFGSGISNRLVSTFNIPQQDFLEGVRSKNIVLGNIGEGEFVLNPKWAKDYLSDIDGKKASILDDGSITYNQPKIKEENNLKSFFNGSNLKSFDTETTGLNFKDPNLSKRDRIWQVGLATDGIGGVEEHTNPFFISNANGELELSPKMSKPYLESSLKNSNGRFSQLAFENGNFNTFMSLYEDNKLSSLEKSLGNTLGTIDKSDVVVLQNMNFENQMLKSSLDQGLISKDFYEKISDRMLTTSIDRDNNTVSLFQRPAKVQQQMRKADMMFHTEYLNNLSEDTFQKYRETVNSAISEYSTVINDKQRVGAVAVELQDLTKAFLANGANAGLIDKKTSTLGLNVDFLSRAILGVNESHTALKDSEDTISLFKKMWNMNSELSSGLDISKETLGVFDNIKKQQPEEINKRFISTVRSVINDFKDNSYTKISNNLSWYNPEILLKNKIDEGFSITKLDEIALAPKKREYNFGKALESATSRYQAFNNNIGGFDRSKFISNIMEEYNAGLSFNTIHERVDNQYFSYKNNITNEESIIPKEIKNSIDKGFWDEKTSLFGKEMKVKSKATILGGLAVGLGYMALSPKPSQQMERNYDNVSEQFYDEQYLGTAFVDFKERNKHYMM